MAFLFWLTLVLFVTVCLFLILLILIQKGRGGGLASAFGGAGGSTAFGSKTGDVLTWATSVVFGIFLLLAIVLNWTANARDKALATAAAVQNPAGAPTNAAGSDRPTPPAVPTPPSVPVAPAGPPAPATPRPTSGPAH